MSARRRPRSRLQRILDDAEREAIRAALAETWITTWNVRQAARLLGVPLSTLKWKMRRLNIRRGEP